MPMSKISVFKFENCQRSIDASNDAWNLILVKFAGLLYTHIHKKSDPKFRPGQTWLLGMSVMCYALADRCSPVRSIFRWLKTPPKVPLMLIQEVVRAMYIWRIEFVNITSRHLLCVEPRFVVSSFRIVHVVAWREKKC